MGRALGWGLLGWLLLLGAGCANELEGVYEGSGPLLRGEARVEWVVLEGGSFSMGSAKGDSDELPVRNVTVPAFALSKTEVTVVQYRACVEAAACTVPATGTYCNWNKSGRDEHPINCVDWGQASAFAAWVGGRLPSEAEWEYAARSGGKAREYPWGDEQADCSRAVMNDGGLGCGTESTARACSRSAGNTVHGLCDMAGNVWEWVADWHGPYGEAPSDGSARTESAEYRVFRGGSWFFTDESLRAADRNRNSADFRGAFLGFRVARTPP